VRLERRERKARRREQKQKVQAEQSEADLNDPIIRKMKLQRQKEAEDRLDVQDRALGITCIGLCSLEACFRLNKKIRDREEYAMIECSSKHDDDCYIKYHYPQCWQLLVDNNTLPVLQSPCTINNCTGKCFTCHYVICCN
jgi:hypothetical protein